jgi:hypothetical protein
MGGTTGLMPIQVQTSLMAGGLDLATPPIALPSGRAIAAANYEPDVAGYTSMGGYERFDGRPRPSDTDNQTLVAERRDAIGAVPGTGPVRGVWVFDENIYAFRDQANGTAGMFRATAGGWTQVVFGSVLQFASGTVEFVQNEYAIGMSSGAMGQIDRIIVREGAWDGTASGYLIVSHVVGTFIEENIAGSESGGAAIGYPLLPINIAGGGRFDFCTHNFYGAASRTHMYFVNGVDTAFEFNGSVLSPIQTGITAGTSREIVYLLADNEDTILAANGDSIIMSALFDSPSFVTHFQNHLFLGYTSGTVLNSALGEPLEFQTTLGAGEIAFGNAITGLLTAAVTSLVIFGQNRIDYLTGQDSTTFTLNALTDQAGAQPYTAQMLDTPVYLDDGGVHSISTSAAFGDWRMGSLTQLIERLVRQKLQSGVLATASMVVKAKDQYRLFWEDGTGVTMYVGRKNPEALPFQLPVRVYCACSGETENGEGDRLFVGCQDGYVYEMNRGTSYDGNAIDSYIRLPFTAAGSPMQHTRWLKVSFELDTPDDITMGVAFHTDYARGDNGALTNVDVDAGTAIITADSYGSIDWAQPIEGRLEYHLAGVGPNIAATLVHASAVARQHTLSSQTYNFSRRRLKR